jgi:hypothetical protein
VTISRSTSPDPLEAHKEPPPMPDRPSHATKQRALALLQRGYSASEVGKLVGVRSRTVERWKSDVPAQAIDPIRAVADRALDTGTMSEQLRAAEILLKIGATEKPQGSGRVVLNIGGPDVCPHCGESLRAESENGDTAGGTVRANTRQP